MNKLEYEITKVGISHKLDKDIIRVSFIVEPYYQERFKNKLHDFINEFNGQKKLKE